MDILIYYITVDFVGFATHLVLRRKETRKRKEGRMKKGRKRRWQGRRKKRDTSPCLNIESGGDLDPRGLWVRHAV